MLSSSPRGARGMSFAPLRCGMQPDWLSRRVTLLEQRVDRLERRFDELTAHMNVRFDAVEQVLISLQTQIVVNHREMLRLHDDTMRHRRVLHDDTMRHVRVLHEDVIDRISKIKG